MRRRKLLGVVLLITAAGALTALLGTAGLLFSLSHQKGYTDIEYGLVQAGMSRATVETIFGTPLRYGTSCDNNLETIVVWERDGDRVLVFFDQSDKALRTKRVSIPQPSLRERAMEELQCQWRKWFPE